MLEEAAKRLDPDETAASEYGYPEDQTITFSDALASMGHQLRSRITHAFGEKSLEELVQPHRTDMAGIQVISSVAIGIVFYFVGWANNGVRGGHIWS